MKIEYESTLASHCVATSVDAKASWNKIKTNSWDGTLFVATSDNATAKVMQRNVLYSMVHRLRGTQTSSVSSLDGVLRKGKHVGLELCEFTGQCAMRVLQFAGAFCTCALLILKKCPLGTISMPFNSSVLRTADTR